MNKSLARVILANFIIRKYKKLKRKRFIRGVFCVFIIFRLMIYHCTGNFFLKFISRSVQRFNCFFFISSLIRTVIFV